MGAIPLVLGFGVVLAGCGSRLSPCPGSCPVGLEPELLPPEMNGVSVPAGSVVGGLCLRGCISPWRGWIYF
jgi:hypothetical protein